MIEEQIKISVIEIIRHVLGIPDNYLEITEKTYLVDDLHMDSLSFIYLISEIETKFNIELEDEYLSIDHFETVESVLNMLLQKI